MCFSSSTTRILEVIGAPTASIDHYEIRRVFYTCEGNVNGLFCGSWPIPAPLIRTQDKLDRVANQPETVADLLLEVAPVREVEQVRVVDKQHDRWRFAGGLGRVAEL